MLKNQKNIKKPNKNICYGFTVCEVLGKKTVKTDKTEKNHEINKNPFNAFNIRNLYDHSNWNGSLIISRHNLKTIPVKILNFFGHLYNITDNDAVILSKLGSSILTDSKPDKLYHADNWEVMACNIDLLDGKNKNKKNKTKPKTKEKTKKTKIGPKSVDVRTLYKTDNQWTSVVEKAKSMLRKQPPKKIINVWPIIGDDDFRNRMILSDKEAVITVKIAMTLVKGKSITQIFQSDDWELLSNNIKILKY